MPLEYTRFGTQILCRERDTTEEWREVPEVDAINAQIELGVSEAMKKSRTESPPRVAGQVIRSERNIKVAETLGLTGDELADRLARSDYNMGTKIRVSDEEFDKLAESLGLTPAEARARFKGTYWTE